MTPPEQDRRRHHRRDDRTEMSVGTSDLAVSNLSLDGAFVAVLSGMHPDDRFGFELLLDGFEGQPVRGQAIVVWSDPGVGVGVRFELSDDSRARLGRALDALGMPREPAVPVGESAFQPPRNSRRTIAVGSQDPDVDTKVWIRYHEAREPSRE